MKYLIILGLGLGSALTEHYFHIGFPNFRFRVNSLRSVEAHSLMRMLVLAFNTRE